MKRRVHYAWVVLAVGFFGLLAAQGARLAFGAFVVPWEEDFSASRGAISSVSMVSFLVYGLSQPLMGRLVDRFGVRLVFSLGVLLVGLSLGVAALARSTLELALVYGLIASLGFGAASNVAAGVAVTRWFDARRGLAFGVIEAGFGAGQLVLVPGSLLLIEALGWRAALAIVGAFAAVVAFPVLALFLRSSPEEIGTRPYGREAVDAPSDTSGGEPAKAPDEPDVPKVGLFTSRAFWGLSLPFFVCGVTTTGMIDTHLVPYAHDHGHTSAVAGLAVALLAAFNVAGTLASGPLSDRFDGRKILGALYAVRALTILLLLWTNSSAWLVAFGVLFGLVDFASVAPTQLLASRYFRGRSVGAVFGLLFLSHQVGSALGAYVPGFVHDLTDGYGASFLGAVLALLVASLLSFGLPRTDVDRAHATPAGAV